VTQVKEELQVSDKGFFDEYNRLLPFKIPELIYFFQHDKNTAPTLIFFHHRLVADALEMFLTRTHKVIRIDGKTRPKEAERLKDQFQEGGVRYALLSFIAAGVGLTFTHATRVLFAEQPFLPSHARQARDRAIRVGQTKQVLVQTMIKKDHSFDRRILASQGKKRAASEALFC
jgi:SNF2 family DNA or RNA helicase